MSRIAVCTIVAKNYLALARTLGSSLGALHPEVDFHVLVIDPPDVPLTFEQPRATQWAPAQLLPARTFAEMTVRYDITELSTAVKPFLLTKLLEAGYDKAYYFDPDIRIMSALDALFQALDDAAIVLTPHLLAPIPFDGEQPDELAILRAGAYNLGFIGVADRPSTHAFLAWWSERLETRCVNAVEQGLFVDQKWVDLVPGMFPGVRILRDPGYNVAYWNLNARTLSERDGRLYANGEPLYFFHFSGFNPSYPRQLSKHQSRTQVKDGTVLARLLGAYAEALAAHDHVGYRQLPYGYGAFSNGVGFDHVCRAALRHTPRLLDEFPRPFDAGAAPSFFHWLNQPARGAGGPTHYMIGLHRLRPDLQAVFPDPMGRDRAAFQDWFGTRAHESGVPAGFSLPAAVPVAAGSPAAPPAGVNVAGYLTAELGIGEAARGYVNALGRLGVDVALTNFTETLNRLGDDTHTTFADDNPYAVNLLCINADQVPVFLQRMGPDYVAGKYNIGLWAWELPEFPDEWADRFAVFDEIWVGSAYMAEAVAKRSPIPVVNVPYVIDMPAPPAADKAHFGLAAHEFIFLFAFDYQSIFDRKNPLGVVEAFRRAFAPDEPVRLVLKSINGARDPDNRARLRQAAAGLRVTFFEDYMSKADKNLLIASCDAYVSLHRSEGFGLGMAEAMAMAKPVIATAWSGNLEFMTLNNSFLVAYDLVALDRDLGPYRRGQIWAEPDAAAAAALMRQVRAQPEQARAVAARGARDIRANHSPEAIGRIIRSRLDLASAGRTSGGAAGLPATAIGKPTIRQGLRFVRQALKARPELILRPEWASTSGHGRKGVWAKKVIQAVVRAFYADKGRERAR